MVLRSEHSFAFHAVHSLEKRGNSCRAATEGSVLGSKHDQIRRMDRSRQRRENLPLDGFWTMYDRDLWAIGYPKCN